jgi:hypothetical protein
MPGTFARPGVHPARNGKYAGPVVDGKHETARPANGARSRRKGRSGSARSTRSHGSPSTTTSASFAAEAETLDSGLEKLVNAGSTRP